MSKNFEYRANHRLCLLFTANEKNPVWLVDWYHMFVIGPNTFNQCPITLLSLLTTMYESGLLTVMIILIICFFFYFLPQCKADWHTF